MDEIWLPSWVIEFYFDFGLLELNLIEFFLETILTCQWFFILYIILEVGMLLK